jgi:hypothetical protein
MSANKTLAIRAALGAFGDRLNKELTDLGEATLDELNHSSHEHVSLVVGGNGKPIVVLTRVFFCSDPGAVEAALKLAKDRPTS